MRTRLTALVTADSPCSLRSCTEVRLVSFLTSISCVSRSLTYTSTQCTGPAAGVSGGSASLSASAARIYVFFPSQPQPDPLARTGNRAPFVPDVFLDLHAVSWLNSVSTQQTGLLTHVKTLLPLEDPRSAQFSRQRSTRFSSTRGGHSKEGARSLNDMCRWLEYETVIPLTPDLPRCVGNPVKTTYPPGALYTVPYQGPAYPDLLTHEAPTLSTAAALRSGVTSGMRNSQLQERFDRLEEIIEQLGGRDSFELSRTNTQELGAASGDQGTRGKWCNPSSSSLKANGLMMSPSDGGGVSAVAVALGGEEEKHDSMIVRGGGGETQLIDTLAPLHKYDGGAGAPANGVEGRKQQ